MTRCTTLKAALIALALCLSPANAATLYWDINGTTAGAGGGVAPTGTWSNTATNWNTDSAGGLGTISAWTVTTNDAVFSADTTATGTYTVTAVGTPTANNITIEDGTINLSTAISWGGILTINNGARLNFASTLNLAGAGHVLLDGGTLSSSAGNGGSFINLAKEIRIGVNGGTVANTNAANAVNIYSGVILKDASAGANLVTLTKTGVGDFGYGTGAANLAGTTYDKLLVLQGSFRARGSTVDSERAFGAEPASVMTDAITLNGGGISSAMSAAANVLHPNRGMTIGAAGGHIDGPTGSGTLTLQGPLSGSGKLTIKGVAGGLTLTNTGNTTTFTGAVQIDSTTLTLGTASINSSLNATNFSGAGGTLNVTGMSTFTFGSDNSSTIYDGNVTGAGGITKVGTGTLTINANWGSTGDLNINDGAIKFGSATGGLGIQRVNVNGPGTLDMNNIGDTMGSIGGNGSIINAANMTLSGSTGVNNSFTGTHTGGGTLTKSGTSVQGLGGSTSFTAIAFNAGRINFNSNNGAGGAGTTITVGSAAGIEFTNDAPGVVLPNPVVLTAGASPLVIYSTVGNSIEQTGVISGNGRAIQRTNTGVGLFTLSGDNTFDGGVTIISRDLRVGHKNGFGTGPLTLGSTTTAPANLITVSSSVPLAGASAVPNAVVTNRHFQIAGTTDLEFSGPVTLNPLLGADTVRNITVSNTADSIISGVISDASSAVPLAKLGNGKLILKGNNSYAGGTTVTAGTLLVNNTLGSGTGSGPVVVNGGTLGGTGSIAGNVTVNSGTFAPGASIESIDLGGDLSLNATVSGPTSTVSWEYDLGDADVTTVAGELKIDTLNQGINLALSGVPNVAPGTKFTLFGYGSWDGGTFNGLPEGTLFEHEGNLMRIRYADGTPGVNGGTGSAFVTITVPIPEPTSLALAGLGLVGLCLAARRREG